MLNKRTIIIYTGNGKGKTTAAIGSAVRMAGHNGRVLMIQFVKCQNNTGEYKYLRGGGDIDLINAGCGFIFKEKDIEKHKKAARKGMQILLEKLEDTFYNLVVLDEIFYLLKFKLIGSGELLSILHKFDKVDFILTGRDAPAELIKLADIVTEMKEVKHPYKNGIPAKKGIEY